MSDHPSFAHPLLQHLARVLTARTSVRAAEDGAPARAAVALALRIGPTGEPEILLIQRAIRDGDPWSGQVALPGGRWSPNDASLEVTAFRETSEETGLDLTRDAVLLGALDELRPRTPTLPAIIVTPFVVATQGDQPLTPNHEVAAAFWMPLKHLSDPDAARESTVHVRGAAWRVPSFVFGEYVVWGMTERILRQLLGLMV